MSFIHVNVGWRVVLYQSGRNRGRVSRAAYHDTKLKRRIITDLIRRKSQHVNYKVLEKSAR